MVQAAVLIGALVNGIAAVVGGGLGVLLQQRLRKDVADHLMVGVGLAVILAGVQGMAAGGSVLLVTLAMTIGGVCGQLLDLDGLVRRWGDHMQAAAERRFARNPSVSNISRGFVSSTLVICIGSMAIVGSLESGLTLDHSTLFAKSVMDLVINVLMATSMGAGVMLSGPVVFVYEALLSSSAAWVAPLLTSVATTQLLATGSLLLFAVGTNLCGITNIKVANFLPACIAAPLLVPLLSAGGLL